MLPRRYHPALRALHWAIALLIIAALFLGTFVMAPMDNADPGKTFALLKHMAAGTLIFALCAARMFIRPKTKRPAPMLSGIAIADRIVPFVHRVFDGLVLAMIASGIGLAALFSLPETVIGVLRGADLAFPTTYASQPLYTLHVTTARILAAIIALHIVGAFYHQFILRDGLIGRMALLAGRGKSA